MSSIVVLTGASGFIGRPVVRSFLDRGFVVRALVRNPAAFLRQLGSPAALDALPWQLGAPAPDHAFDDAAALVHMACATRGEPGALFDLNVNGTRTLLESARSANPFRVFISSFSAGPAGDAGLSRRSAYSAAKQRGETLFDASRDLILRPGLVVGPGDDGLFARMRTQMERGGPIPLFYGGLTPVQWIHVDDLARAIVDGVERRTTGLYSLAVSEPVTLGEWTRAVAATLGVPARTVPVPAVVSDVGAAMLRAVERLGVRLPVSSDTVYGIKYARPVNTQTDLAALGLQLDGLHATLARVR